MEAPKFHIGQTVVAITNSLVWKKGQEFEVLDIKANCCTNHCLILIAVNSQSRCGNCLQYSGGAYYAQHNFAPKEQTTAQISSFTYDDAMNLVTKKEKV